MRSVYVVVVTIRWSIHRENNNHKNN